MVVNGHKGLPPERIGEAMRSAHRRKAKTRHAVTPDPIQDFMAVAPPKRMVDAAIPKRLGTRDVEPANEPRS